MAHLISLAATAYRGPSHPLSRKGGGEAGPLIAIIEDADEDVDVDTKRRDLRSTDKTKIEQWLSPLSDHFPTPRGNHFLAAPVLPSTSSSLDVDCDVDDASTDSSASHPSTNTGPWGRHSMGTDVTEFDTDVSDEADDGNHEGRKASRQSSSDGRRSSATGSRIVLAPLVMPGEVATPPCCRSRTMMSPDTPLSPPNRVHMSPAVKSFMQAQQQEDTPSLASSLDSELAAMSAPPTPCIGGADEVWSGVRLQPVALETLQALSGAEPDLDEVRSHGKASEVPEGEMSETQHPRASVGNTARRQSLSERSLAGLTRLDIPSPGVFFSGLSSAARSTWQSRPGQNVDDDVAPPTSTTAEQFYKLPWSSSAGNVVEQVLELPETKLAGLPTALRIQPTPETVRRVPPVSMVASLSLGLPRPASAIAGDPDSHGDATQMVDDDDTSHAKKQQAMALPHLDRTELWLMAQRAYLQGVVGFSPGNSGAETEKQKTDGEEQEQTYEKTGLEQTKTVRFSEAVVDAAKLRRQDSAYYRAFADLVVRSHASDAFVHRLPRFEALQAQRVALRQSHRDRLLGKCQLSVEPSSAKKRASANVVRGDVELVDDLARLRAERETEALGQMAMAAWHVAATKLLNGGRLVAAPVAKRLARLARIQPGPNTDPPRMLDLAGVGTGDWAWHVALQYPSAKIYTVTTRQVYQHSTNLQSPPNHRQVAVDRLTRLPFPDNHFDLVSARELHAVLKSAGENGADEWHACLSEVMRVLKPGAYLDFSVLDADLINAGPLGNAKAVEFGFVLQTLGYDPSPTRSFLCRLAAAGFANVRRAWLYLLVGPRPSAQTSSPTATTSSEACGGRAPEPKTVVSGSADRVAAVTGLAAGWSWERWLLRAEMERTAGQLRSLGAVTASDRRDCLKAHVKIADVAAVVDEGRARGTAFRLLKGYARKPAVSGWMKMRTNTIGLC